MPDTRPTLTPVEFLNARLGEIEQRAQKATQGRWKWVDPGFGIKQALVAGPPSGRLMVVPSGEPDVYPSLHDAAHIVYWDPHRVLAWCESMRKLIELHKPDGVYSHGYGGCRECSCAAALGASDCLNAGVTATRS